MNKPIKQLIIALGRKINHQIVSHKLTLKLNFNFEFFQGLQCLKFDPQMLVNVESQFSSKQLPVTVFPIGPLMYHLEKTALAVFETACVFLRLLAYCLWVLLHFTYPKMFRSTWKPGLVRMPLNVVP